jgi:hypothetical protein
MLEEEVIRVQRRDGDGDGVYADGGGVVGLLLASAPTGLLRYLRFVGAQ